MLQDNAMGVRAAADMLRRGGLVAFPTETVYGLGADAANAVAVAAIYAAKSRPTLNPLIIHVADLSAAQQYGVFDDISLKLAAAFWPGPLSLVVPLRGDSGLAPAVSAGADTVAIRVPANPVAQALLKSFDSALAAPSANMSGQVSPTCAAHVMQGLSGRIDAVLDGGNCIVGLESTIVRATPNGVALLRAGGASVEDIAAVTGADLGAATPEKTRRSPGLMASHYAPRMAVHLNVKRPRDGHLWLGFGPHCENADLNLSPEGNLSEAAANLFAYLRILDAKAGKTAIDVAPIPVSGLGLAIADRLRRAAAPRP